MMADAKRDRDQNLGGGTAPVGLSQPALDSQDRRPDQERNSTSIVVGTGHFCGTNSVIDLLQKKGYKIEQLVGLVPRHTEAVPKRADWTCLERRRK